MKSLVFGVVIFLLGCTTQVKGNKKEILDSLLNINVKDLTPENQAIVYRRIAYFHTDPGVGLTYTDSAFNAAAITGNELLVAEIWEEVSGIQRVLGNQVKSLEASFNALKIYDQFSLPEKEAAVYAEMGSSALLSEDFDNAIKNLKLALSIYEGFEKSINLGLTILNLGEAYRLAGNYDSAQMYFVKALELNGILKNEVIEAYALGNLGMTLSSIGQIDSANRCLDQSIKILLPMQDYYALASFEMEKAIITISEADQINHLNTALEYALKGNHKEQLRDIYQELSNRYFSQKKYYQAYESLSSYQSYKDSISNLSTIRETEQLKFNYAINQKQLEIELLDAKNRTSNYLIIGISTSVVLLICIVIILYFQYKQKQKDNKLLVTQKITISKRDSEKATLLKELNHRVKNNLQIVSSLLSLQSYELGDHPAAQVLDSGKARVEAMSLIHQKLYQEDTETKISLDQYINELVLNLFHSYGIKWQPQFELNHIDLKIDKAIPIALIVNELVSNSLKYAYPTVMKIEPKLSISLKNNEVIELIVADNGKGIGPETNSSFGLKLVHSLSAQINASLERIESIGTSWKLTFQES